MTVKRKRGTATIGTSSVYGVSPFYVNGASSRFFSSSIALSPPTNTLVGDLALVFIAVNSGGTITPPAGWSTVAASITGTGVYGVTMHAFYRVLQSTDSVTFNFGNSYNAARSYITYRNASVASYATAVTGSSAASLAASTLTISTAENIAVYCWGAIADNSGQCNVTIPGTITDGDGSFSGSDAYARTNAGYEVCNVTGTTTTRTATFSQNGAGAAWSIELGGG